MLDPTYNKIKESLKQKIATDAPSTVSPALDGWTAFHHGYLGINCHYLKDWNREIICLACIPFDESHTAENIYGKLKSVLVDWDIFRITGPSLRDNAANMKGMYFFTDMVSKRLASHARSSPHCYIYSRLPYS